MSPSEPPRSSLANKPLAAAVAVASVGGLLAVAWALGPDNPSAKQCFDTEYEFQEEARLDPQLREKRFRHLAFVTF